MPSTYMTQEMMEVTSPRPSWISSRLPRQQQPPHIRVTEESILHQHPQVLTSDWIQYSTQFTLILAETSFTLLSSGRFQQHFNPCFCDIFTDSVMKLVLSFRMKPWIFSWQKQIFHIFFFPTVVRNCLFLVKICIKTLQVTLISSSVASASNLLVPNLLLRTHHTKHPAQ